MNTIIQTLKTYLFDVLDIQLAPYLWEKQDTLPFFLVNAYEFYEISIKERSFLLMIAKDGENVTPATLKKHKDLIETQWNGHCIYVQKRISPYNRQRLIHHRIPFIIPGNQMYLPDLGMDLREYFYTTPTPKEHLTPATQALIIYALCQSSSLGYTASTLIKILGYSRMTLLQAFNELEKAHIGTIERQGRDRYWVFQSKYKLWQQAHLLLNTPVKHKTWIKEKEPSVKAGLSALGEKTMLTSPTLPVYAIDWREWKEWQAFSLPSEEEAIAQLEIWCYDPKLLSYKEVVNSFSLYLSLKDTKDERIESALEEMMENIEW